MNGTHTDGDGWTQCALGHRHWGRFGAAGLLVYTVDDAGVARVLMQLRSGFSHHGDTWGIPGGARGGAEDAAAAACREAVEEAGLDTTALRIRRRHVDDHGGWAYVTVVADTVAPLPTSPNAESADLQWRDVDQVHALPLHPGFAATWPRLRARPVSLVVDVANVLGADPFRWSAAGWWRDRRGATAALLVELDRLRGRTTRSAAGDAVVIRQVVAVLEGVARAAGSDRSGWVRAYPSPGSGDDAVVEVAAGLSDAIVVTADAGLRRRVTAAAVAADRAGPRWLLGELDAPDVKGVAPGADP